MVKLNVRECLSYLGPRGEELYSDSIIEVSSSFVEQSNLLREFAASFDEDVIPINYNYNYVCDIILLNEMLPTILSGDEIRMSILNYDRIMRLLRGSEYLTMTHIEDICIKYAAKMLNDNARPADFKERFYQTFSQLSNGQRHELGKHFSKIKAYTFSGGRYVASNEDLSIVILHYSNEHLLEVNNLQTKFIDYLPTIRTINDANDLITVTSLDDVYTIKNEKTGHQVIIEDPDKIHESIDISRNGKYSKLNSDVIDRLNITTFPAGENMTTRVKNEYSIFSPNFTYSVRLFKCNVRVTELFNTRIPNKYDVNLKDVDREFLHDYYFHEANSHFSPNERYLLINILSDDNSYTTIIIIDNIKREFIQSHKLNGPCITVPTDNGWYYITGYRRDIQDVYFVHYHDINMKDAQCMYKNINQELIQTVNGTLDQMLLILQGDTNNYGYLLFRHHVYPDILHYIEDL